MCEIENRQTKVLEEIYSIYETERKIISKKNNDIIKNTKLSELYPDLKIDNVSLDFYYDTNTNLELNYNRYGVIAEFDNEIEIDFSIYETEGYESIDVVLEVEILNEHFRNKYNLDIEEDCFEIYNIYNKLKKIIEEEAWNKLSDFSKKFYLKTI